MITFRISNSSKRTGLYRACSFTCKRTGRSGNGLGNASDSGKREAKCPVTVKISLLHSLRESCIIKEKSPMDKEEK